MTTTKKRQTWAVGRMQGDAAQVKVRCGCGHVGTLERVRWWGVVQRWSGECRECGNTLTVTP